MTSIFITSGKGMIYLEAVMKCLDLAYSVHFCEKAKEREFDQEFNILKYDNIELSYENERLLEQIDGLKKLNDEVVKNAEERIKNFMQ